LGGGNLIKKVAIPLFILLTLAAVEAKTIKVLIIDDVFQKIPQNDAEIERMGRLRGDLLVSGNRYRGNIEIWRGKSGLYLINELPLEEYVKSVVSAEIGINWHIEALKVQAVIARTYAIHKMLHNKNGNYDLTSSVLHQVYKGKSIDPRISSAVAATIGEVLVYKGQIIESLYHSTCGGRTERPEEVFSRGYPYLKSVESSCELSPYWIWERKISLQEIEKSLNIIDIKKVEIASYTSTGRVKTLGIEHSAGVLQVKASELRKFLGWKRLPSTKFDITRDNGKIIFDGRGYGHGVGLCQWCSLQMARDGMNYKDILAFYYPGTTIQIYENR
jgi:stage II sporulation protein D